MGRAIASLTGWVTFFRPGLGGLTLALGLWAAAAPAARAMESRNVVLVTLDGVRRADFYDRALFPWFWRHAGARGAVGNIRLSNPHGVSLPAYQAILAGRAQPCRDNHCGRVRAETLLERVRAEVGGRREDAALIASWEPMAMAAARREGRVYVSAGNQPVVGGESDPYLQTLAAQARDQRTPWWGGRWDVFTFEYGKRFLSLYQPRFLMLSFLDSDQWAHRRHAANYRAILRRYDGWLRELFERLRGLGRYGRETTVLITTDHGRGEGASFARHGHGLPASQTAWLWALGPCTEPATTLPADRDSHADLRPTIEYLLGLRPRACADCGSPIPEVSSCTQGTYARRAHADSDPMVLGPDATVQLSSVR